MAIVIGEAVQSLRDNDADLVELKGLTGTSGTRISNAEVRELAEVLAVNTTLTNLDLSKTWLEPEEGVVGVQAIGQALTVNTTLTRLDLSHNSFGKKGVRATGEALALNTGLKHLDLSNSLGWGDGQAIKLIGQGLAVHKTLTTIRLSANIIGAKGAAAIAQAVKVNKALTSLDLGFNRIGAKGASQIAQALQVNNVLTTLHLYDNPIGAKGATKIAKALQVNHVLTTLDLDDCGLDEGLLHEIDRFIAVNRALDSKVLAVMMSMHARLGAESGLKVFSDSLVKMICDVFCRESKASSLFDEATLRKRQPEAKEGTSHRQRRTSVQGGTASKSP